jgi:hypothetical protein
VNLGVACTTGKSGQNFRYCTVGGGRNNTASGELATVGGGYNNTASYTSATVGGGYGNTASNIDATVGGGWDNTASGDRATVGGGYHNLADTSYATVGGGYYNAARGYDATVGGGNYNTASGLDATVGGGHWNSASGPNATVGGGYKNLADTAFATVGGGFCDTASGYGAAVPGGFSNTASGSYSFAAGRRAKANHSGSFVWADGTDANFASTGNNQFLIRASGGVGIGTDSPEYRLDVTGNRIRLKDGVSGDWIAMRTDGNDLDLQFEGGDLFIQSTTAGEHILLNPVTNSNVGIGTTEPSERLDVNGRARIRLVEDAIGDATPVVVDDDGVLYKSSPSSKRYKQNIRNLDVDPEKVLKLQSVRFEWKKNGAEDIGLIAEEVQQVIPDLVRYNKDGNPEGVRYDKLAVYLLEALKAQQERISTLEREIDDLKK